MEITYTKFHNYIFSRFIDNLNIAAHLPPYDVSAFTHCPVVSL